MIAGIAATATVFGAHGAAKAQHGAFAQANAETELSEEEQELVARLKERDREVRAHEQAHAAAGGPHTGAPSYEYQRGPDGKLYAISGEVSIDASPVAGNPSATVAKMEVVIRAALAPREPSAQDRRVAAQAAAVKAEALAELREERQQEAREALESFVSEGQSPDGATQSAANAAYTRANALTQEISSIAFNAEA